MKTISTTNARKNISALINSVKESGSVFVIGRRNRPEVLLLKFPTNYNEQLNDITNINVYSESFSFLKQEPDIYSVSDLKKRYD